MGYDAVYNFFLFVFWDIIYVPGLVQLRLTTTIALGPIQNHVDIDLIATAREFVSGSEGPMQVHFDFGRGLMVPAGAHFRNGVILVASVTLQEVKIGPDLPVDFLPRDTVGLSDVSYELLQVPGLVNNVFGTHLAVAIHKRSSFAAAEHFSLFLGEQFVAVGTLVEVVFVLL